MKEIHSYYIININQDQDVMFLPIIPSRTALELDPPPSVSLKGWKCKCISFGTTGYRSNSTGFL